MANVTKKIEMKMKVSSDVITYYPKTTADNVYLTDGNTVQSTITSLQSTVSTLSTDLSALITRVNTMYDKLYFDSIYMTDSNGIILTDGSGTNLVAVY